MGQGQSSTGGADTAAEVKTSYYELLGVDRQATSEEIKKAYRRKALELHPDRNYGEEENATRLFADIGAAYEVLSDPQERAWYDSHEAQILRGDADDAEHYEANIRVTTTEEVVHMMAHFNSRIEFTDSPSGFYGFCRDAFARLAREEEAAADWKDSDPVDYPSFGHKDDSYEDVVKTFYAAWSGFSTRKLFAWKDKYHVRPDDYDRRTRRYAEKENQRYRDEARRDFNDTVRQLVAFVRKRDPRYKANAMTDEQRIKAMRDSAKEQATRARAANAAKAAQGAAYYEPAQVVAEDAELFSEEEELQEDHYECVACQKTFKSEKQFAAHEKSKKHKKSLQALRRKMMNENKHLNLDDFESSGVGTPVSGQTSEPEADEAIHDAGEDEVLGDFEDLGLEGDTQVDEESRTDDQSEVKPGIKLVDDEDEDDPSGDVEDLKTTKTPGAFDESDDSEPQKEKYLSETASSSTAAAQPKPLGKAAQKRAKKAAQAQASEPSSSESKFQCATCRAGFPSKTRLFQHLKDHKNHAALKAMPAQKAGKGKRK